MQRLNSAKTYSEMCAILDGLGEEYINRIPKKLYNLIRESRDVEYNPKIFNADGMIDEASISRETIALFAVLNVKYFMQDEQEKSEYMQILKENEKVYQQEQREKYNADNLFKKKEESNLTKTAIVEYKGSIFKKFFNKIRMWFKKK